MQIDLLIVGQGLAGSLLAIEALNQGLNILVVDDGLENASQVAAGLVNPLSGLRLLKTQGIEELLPVAKTVYQHLERRYQQVFWHERDMLRVMKSAQQRQFAKLRLSDPGYQAYLQSWATADAALYSPFGVLQQTATAYLDTRALLAAIKSELISSNRLIASRFDPAELQLQAKLQWRDIHPQYIVFCEGHHARFNPWFRHLPWQVAQGDILTLATQHSLPETILNYGHWLLPTRSHQARLGASFSQLLDLKPNTMARAELLKGLAQVLPTPGDWQVIDHQVGIRPATQDKQAFIGAHPQFSQLMIFNGFGAKGSLAIPGSARRLLSLIRFNQALPAYCDIQRLTWPV